MLGWAFSFLLLFLFPISIFYSFFFLSLAVTPFTPTPIFLSFPSCSYVKSIATRKQKCISSKYRQVRFISQLTPRGEIRPSGSPNEPAPVRPNRHRASHTPTTPMACVAQVSDLSTFGRSVWGIKVGLGLQVRAGPRVNPILAGVRDSRSLQEPV